MARVPAPPGTVRIAAIVGQREISATTVLANHAAMELQRLNAREQLSATLPAVRRVGPLFRQKKKVGLWPGATPAHVWDAVDRGVLKVHRGPWGSAFDRAQVEAHAARYPLRRRTA